MKLLLVALLLAAPIEFTATQIHGPTGSAALSGNLPTRTLDMAGLNQLSLAIAVTPGSTTTFTAKCYQSATGLANSWGQISLCDGNAASACAPDVRTYTLADYEAQGTVKVVDSNWKVKKRYVRCRFNATGTGTIATTGTGSWQ